MSFPAEPDTFSRRILSAEDKMRSSIERRRIADEERKKTVLDPYKRHFGIDTEGIQKQIHEKQEAREAERLREAYFENMVREQTVMLELQEQDRQDFKKKQIEDIIAFRKDHQSFQSRREFDLNDPDSLKKGLPARVGDNDPRIGPSSMQKFNGEDLSNPERKAIQQEQMRVWIQQHSEEKDQRRSQERALDKQYEDMEASLIQEATNIERELEDRRKREVMTLGTYHQSQAVEKREKDLQYRIRNAQQSEAEIQHTLNTDMMTENPALAYSESMPNRLVTAQYKGMSAREREAVLKEQERQRKQKMTQKELEQEEQRQWDQQQEALRRSAVLQEREKKRASQRQLQEQHREHERQAEEHRQRYEHLYNNVYSNQPTDEFFAQFGTTSR